MSSKKCVKFELHYPRMKFKNPADRVKLEKMDSQSNRTAIFVNIELWAQTHTINAMWIGRDDQVMYLQSKINEITDKAPEVRNETQTQ